MDPIFEQTGFCFVVLKYFHADNLNVLKLKSLLSYDQPLDFCHHHDRVRSYHSYPFLEYHYLIMWDRHEGRPVILILLLILIVSFEFPQITKTQRHRSIMQDIWDI